jgi:hypothetical protein
MKQETLEEAAEKYADYSNDYVPMSFGGEFNETTKRDFIEGAKWQAEKMYSEEDLIELLQNCWSESAINLAQQTNKEEYITFSEWIEKNL